MDFDFGLVEDALAMPTTGMSGDSVAQLFEGSEVLSSVWFADEVVLTWIAADGLLAVHFIATTGS